jgi:hypothetical protein
MHLQISFLQAQNGHAFIQHLAKVSTPFRLGAEDAQLDGTVPPDGIHMSVTSVMFCSRISEHAREGHQVLLTHDDDTLSTVKLLPSSKELLL